MLGFYIVHMIGVYCNSKTYPYTYADDCIWMQFFVHIEIVTCIFIIEIVCILLDVTRGEGELV